MPQATALLAFQARTACQPYAALLAEARWEALVELFLADMFRLHSLPPRSLLEVHLQVHLWFALAVCQWCCRGLQ